MEPPAPATTDPARPRPRRRRRRGLLLLVLLVLLPLGGLLVLEIVLRLQGPMVLGMALENQGMCFTDAEGHLLGSPGWEGALTWYGEPVPIRLNNLGMRSPDIGPKAPGERRVLVLGDSFLFGLAVGADETVPALLGPPLSEALGVPVVVGNAGMMGTGPRDQIGVLGHLKDVFQPDAVISFLYLGNDFSDDCNPSWGVVEGHRFQAPVARAAQGSLRFRLALRFRVLTLLEQILARQRREWSVLSSIELTPEEIALDASLPPPDQRDHGLFMDARAQTPHVVAALDRLRAELTELRELAAPAPLLFVVIPTYFHIAEGSDKTWRAALRSQGLRPEDHQHGLVQRRLLELARELDIPAIDLTPLYLGHETPDALYQVGLLHWTPPGHAVAAAAVLPQVQALLEGAGR